MCVLIKPKLWYLRCNSFLEFLTGFFQRVLYFCKRECNHPCLGRGGGQRFCNRLCLSVFVQNSKAGVILWHKMGVFPRLCPQRCSGSRLHFFFKILTLALKTLFVTLGSYSHRRPWLSILFKDVPHLYLESKVFSGILRIFCQYLVPDSLAIVCAPSITTCYMLFCMVLTFLYSCRFSVWFVTLFCPMELFLTCLLHQEKN